MTNKERQDKAASNFLQDVYSIHGAKYLVLDSYTRSKVHVNVLCNTCGNVWAITPNNLNRGHGCPHCAKLALGRCSTAKVANTFIQDVYNVHGNNLTPTSAYINSTTKVTYLCNRCKSTHSAIPTDLKQGYGCPTCARAANSISQRVFSDRPTILYFVHFEEYSVWKIGCTSKSVLQRFARTGYVQPTILHQELFSFGGDAYNLEGHLLRHFREVKYRGPDLLTKGNTELLTQEVNFKEALEQAKVELGITNV